MKWVRLKKYCELSGDTAYAVHHRRSRGVWLDGVHTRIAADRRLWVNLDEVNKWVEQGLCGGLAHQNALSQLKQIRQNNIK